MNSLREFRPLKKSERGSELNDKFQVVESNDTFQVVALKDDFPVVESNENFQSFASNDKFHYVESNIELQRVASNDKFRYVESNVELQSVTSQYTCQSVASNDNFHYVQSNPNFLPLFNRQLGNFSKPPFHQRQQQVPQSEVQVQSNGSIDLFDALKEMDLLDPRMSVGQNDLDRSHLWNNDLLAT